MTTRALVELVLLSLACGPLGVWVLLFRQSYAAESMAHAMLPGLVVAALVGAPLVLGAGAGVLLFAGVTALFLPPRRVDPDTGVAVAVTTLFGLGAVLALAPDVPARLGELLFGDLLGLTAADLAVAAALVAFTLAGLAASRRDLALVGFGRDSARALGASPARTDLVLLALLGLTTVAAVQGVGALLVAALILAPGAAALRLAGRLTTAMVVAAAFAALAGVGGMLISLHLDLAAGASVVGCAIGLFALALLTPEISRVIPMRRMRRLLIPLALLALFGALAPGAQAAPRPIVYVVVLDGLDGDKVDANKAPFISSLLAGQNARATYYRESRSVMVAETNPNHAAMMTGAYGDASGIPGNAFALYAPLENGDSCRAVGPTDETKLPTETSGQNANCPQAQTLFEAVKRQGNPDGITTAAIFGKPKLGRIFAARNADRRHRDVDHLWAPCASGSDDDAYCAGVPTNPITGYAADDRTVMNEVLRSIDAGVGARRERPDFTFVNLHQIDSIGHATGTGLLYDSAIGQADTEIRRMVDKLWARGEWSRTALILASDHAMDTTPVKTNLSSQLSAAGVSESSYLVVQNGGTDMFYLANRRDPGRFELLRRMRQAVLGAPGTNEALYREANPRDGGSAHTLSGVRPGWRLAGPRTGDLVATHDPGGAFSDPASSSNPLPGNHGGSFTRDNLIAITGGLPGIRQQSLGARRSPIFDDTLLNPTQAENADLASTVMGLFGLFHTRDNEGRFLTESFDLNAIPGRTAPARRATIRLRRIRRARSLRVRPRSRCRRLRRRRVGVRVSLGPPGGHYDLQVRTRGRPYRSIQRNRARSVVDVRLKQARRYRFRARVRSASSIPGAWRIGRARVRPYRCG